MESVRSARNRYCTACAGVCPFDAERCPHCSEPLPRERIEWFNFSDFEPDLEAGEARAIRRTVAFLALLALLLLIWWLS